jgi:hypothetical protein
MLHSCSFANVCNSSEGYCSTLSRLLQLAPPIPNHSAPFVAEQAQSILVTHYVDLDTPRDVADDHDNNMYNHKDIDDIDDNGATAVAAAAAAANGSPSWTIEQQRQPRDLPFPIQDHDLFIHSLLAQRMLCLEIASGSATVRPARLVKKGRVHLLLPGSLRKRGEFSIVDVSLTPDDNDDDDEDEDVVDVVAANSSTRNSINGSDNKSYVAAVVKEKDEVNQARSQHFKTTSTQSRCQSKPTRYRWTVSNVEFHNVNNLP